MNDKSGLFTSRDCCSSEVVAHEAVVNYREWATTKLLLKDRLARRVKIVDYKIFLDFQVSFVLLKNGIGNFYE
jgi:hypothetical protein